MDRAHRREQIRRLLERRDREGLTYRELARRTGESPRTLAWWGSRLRRERSRSRGFVERGREVGTLHALGGTRGQVAAIFLAGAVAISAIAAALGIAGGLAFARALLLLGVTTLGSGHHIQVFDVPRKAILALTVLGVGVALLGSVYPMLRARASSPSAILRGEEVLDRRALSRGFHLFAAILLALLLPGLYFVIVPVVGVSVAIEASRPLIVNRVMSLALLPATVTITL